MRWAKFEIEKGMLPLKELLHKLTILRLFQTEKSNGNDPENLLDWRYRLVKFFSLKKPSGKGPLIPFDLRLTTSSVERRLEESVLILVDMRRVTHVVKVIKQSLFIFHWFSHNINQQHCFHHQGCWKNEQEGQLLVHFLAPTEKINSSPQLYVK